MCEKVYWIIGLQNEENREVGNFYKSNAPIKTFHRAAVSFSKAANTD